MTVVGDQYEPTRQKTVAYHNLINRSDMTILTDITMMTNGDAGRKSLVMIMGPTTKDRMALDDGVVTDNDMLRTASPQTTEASYDRMLSQMAQTMTHP